MGTSMCVKPYVFSIDPSSKPTYKLDILEQAHSYGEMEEEAEDTPEACRPVTLAYTAVKISCVAFTCMKEQANHILTKNAHTHKIKPITKFY